MPILIVTIVLGALAAFLWSRRRRAKNDGDSVPSLTLLLRTPRILTSAHLSESARRAFGHEIPEEDVIATEETVSLVRADGYAFSVLSLPTPLTEDPERDAESIGELRLRVAYAEHRAIVSVGCVARPEEATRAEAYAKLGLLTAELVDDTTLLAMCDETRTGSLIDDATLAGLRGGDPVRALREVAFDAIGLVSGEDPRMVAATKEARERLPEFLAALAQGTAGPFLAKGPFTDGTHTEFMWIEAETATGESIRGTLANAPFQVRGLKKGSTVEIPFKDVSDWAFSGEDGPVGLFTERIVREAL